MTEKQQRFIDAYIQNGGNATQAALHAGFSERTAYSQGQRLLKNVEVRATVDERLKELESERIAKDAEILEFLTSVLRGEVTEKVLVQVGTGKGFFHSEFKDKPSSIKERLTAATALAKIYLLSKPSEEIDDVIIELPEKNTPID